MTEAFVPFDTLWDRITSVATSGESLPDGLDPVYVVRNLYGQVCLCAPDAFQQDDTRRTALERLAARLRDALGVRGCPQDSGLLFVDPSLLTSLDTVNRQIRPGLYLADRLIVGSDWWTIRPERPATAVWRCTLFSVKGGVGRTTTAAVLAWHLARTGQRVLVVDLDLESPGISSAMLSTAVRPTFGVTDWFVEDLVGQGDHVLQDMTASPTWARDLEGDVRVVPSHGRDPGEYLAKLGRVYIDTPGSPWSLRLQRMLSRLETRFKPTIAVLESRSGLHDIAACTVTDLDAEVVLFGLDSDSHWTDYRVLFRHWQTLGLAQRIRERLSIVSALTPELDKPRYMQGFREQSWNLFRELLYDDVPAAATSGAEFSFDLHDIGAPHDPLQIDWNRGLAAGSSLRDPDWRTAEGAYARFLSRFEDLVPAGTRRGGNNGGNRR